MRLAAFYVFLLSICCLSGCDGNRLPVAKAEWGTTPPIYPEYQDATIPVNIAPLNFEIRDEGEEHIVQIKGKGEPLVVKGRGVVDIPLRAWRRLLGENQGDSLSVTVFSRQKEDWYRYQPFAWTVSSDSIDGYVAYRLIEPTYANWNGMAICQRDLASFEETEILSNRKSGNNCINCHTFNQGNPDELVMHMRKVNAGTLLIRDGVCQKLNTQTPYTISNFVYPDWHPSGEQIAFSTNITQMSFYDAHPKIIEVYDAQSDIVMYDIQRNEVYTSPMLSDPDKLENFPFFAPDGKRLYFCTCDRVDSLPQQFEKVRYRICSIGFDLASRRFDERVDTLVDLTASGKSATLPSVSPDGRFILCSVAPSGCFSSWIPESDLYLYDLREKTVRPASEWNSEQAESCTSWSSNSRWVVFSSRREDGVYNRLYIAHIDASGRLGKPFLLPQRDPAFNLRDMKAYNLPRLVKGAVRVSPVAIGRCAESASEKTVRFNEQLYKPEIHTPTGSVSEVN